MIEHIYNKYTILSGKPVIRQLEIILEKMKELEKEDDVEEAHGKADDLLLLTLDIICELHDFKTAKDIINSYNNIPKWYA